MRSSGDAEKAVCVLFVQINRGRPFLRGMLHSGWPWERDLYVLQSLRGGGMLGIPQ